MDMFTYPPSLEVFLSLRRGGEGRPNVKHRFCSTGVFRLDTQGQGEGQGQGRL